MKRAKEDMGNHEMEEQEDKKQGIATYLEKCWDMERLADTTNTTFSLYKL